MADYFAEFDSQTGKDIVLASLMIRSWQPSVSIVLEKNVLWRHHTVVICIANKQKKSNKGENKMNKYRINYRLTRENGTKGFKSTTIYADDILSALTELYQLALEQKIEIKIYSIFYLAEGIETIV